jgi:hypothetical protein
MPSKSIFYLKTLFLPAVLFNVFTSAACQNSPWLITELPTARLDMAGAYVGGKALFAGGLSGFEPDLVFSKAVDLYDVAGNTWTSAQLSAARNNIAAAVWGNKAIFAGGNSNLGFFDEVDIYDASTGLWSLRKLPAKRSNMGAATVDPRSWEAKNE